MSSPGIGGGTANVDADPRAAVCESVPFGCLEDPKDTLPDTVGPRLPPRRIQAVGRDWWDQDISK